MPPKLFEMFRQMIQMRPGIPTSNCLTTNGEILTINGKVCKNWPNFLVLMGLEVVPCNWLSWSLLYKLTLTHSFFIILLFLSHHQLGTSQWEHSFRRFTGTPNGDRFIFSYDFFRIGTEIK